MQQEETVIVGQLSKSYSSIRDLEALIHDRYKHHTNVSRILWSVVLLDSLFEVVQI
jgi:hypothetical protein